MRGEIFPLGLYGHSCYGCSPLIYRRWEYERYRITLIHMFIYTNVYLPDVYDHLGLYIPLVNDSIVSITLIGLLYQLIISRYRLIH